MRLDGKLLRTAVQQGCDLLVAEIFQDVGLVGIERGRMRGHNVQHLINRIAFASGCTLRSRAWLGCKRALQQLRAICQTGRRTALLERVSGDHLEMILLRHLLQPNLRRLCLQLGRVFLGCLGLCLLSQVRQDQIVDVIHRFQMGRLFFFHLQNVEAELRADHGGHLAVCSEKRPDRMPAQ